MANSRNSLWLAIAKAALAGLLYVLGAALSGLAAVALHVTLPSFSLANVNPQAAFRAFLLLSPLLGISLLPLALGSSGKRLTRGLALSFILFVTMGLNNAIEMKIFSTFLVHGAMAFVASVIPPALLCGLALAYFLPRNSNGSSFAARARSFLATHSLGSWTWRLLLAILAFPFIYFVFGAMVAPIVVPTWRSGSMGLVLPPVTTILPVQVLRSAIFLLSSLPFFLLRTRSRRSLVFALGFHWFLVGLFGLLIVSWFPLAVRIAHLFEGAADSFAYAAALVFLLLPRQHVHPVPSAAQTASLFPS